MSLCLITPWTYWFIYLVYEKFVIATPLKPIEVGTWNCSYCVKFTFRGAFNLIHTEKTRDHLLAVIASGSFEHLIKTSITFDSIIGGKEKLYHGCSWASKDI